MAALLNLVAGNFDGCSAPTQVSSHPISPGRANPKLFSRPCVAAMSGTGSQSFPKNSPIAYTPAKVMATATALEEIQRNTLPDERGTTRPTQNCATAKPTRPAESNTAAKTFNAGENTKPAASTKGKEMTRPTTAEQARESRS